MTVLRPLLPLAGALLLCQAAASAQTIHLTSFGTVDVSALGLEGWGGGDIDPVTGHLWISDAGITTNEVFEIVPETGALVSSFDASVVPGLDKGPDGIAIQPSTGDLFLFSPFAEDEAGSVTQAGALVSDFPTAHGAAAAAFDASGELWVYHDGQRELQRIDTATWAVVENLPIASFTGRIVSMDFHPTSGHLFAFHDEGLALLEIEMSTGQIVATADMAAHGVDGWFSTAMAFDALGQRLYIGRGINDDADVLHVFGFGELSTAYCFGDGTAAFCPCANQGATGEGCANSSGAGALLAAGGNNSVSADALTFGASQLRPGQPALLFVADNATNGGQGIAFGDGLRCASGNVKRLGAKVPDAGGNATWGPGLAAAGGWSAGETRRFQVWYRDPNNSPCGTSFNLTHGREVVFVP